jgi:transposase-like protein
MALLVCVGVDEEGFREVLAVEVAGSEKGAAYASMLRGLVDRGLSGVQPVLSDDHEGMQRRLSQESCRGQGGRGARCISKATYSRACAGERDERGGG